MTYLENVLTTLEQANAKSYLYGNGEAWDNKKKKNIRRIFPRGKMFMKLWKYEMGSLEREALAFNKFLEEVATNYVKPQVKT